MNVRQWFHASRCFASITLCWCAFILAGATASGQALTSPVGTASGTQTATVTITTAGTLANIYVLTQGATGLDFNVLSPTASPNPCTVLAVYALNDTCTVQYTFAPTHPWVRYGSVSLTDSSGNLLGNVFLSGLGTGPQISYPLTATTAPSPLASGFSFPTGIAVDAKGNVYIADTGNNVIKELVAVGGAIPANPTIMTLANGLNAPSSVAVDGAGNVYFADTGNNSVKEIVAVGGVISSNPTILTLFSGFAGPKGVAVDGNGNVYVADTLNDAIKEIVTSNGVIPSSNPTINPLGSGFMAPAGVFVDGSGNVFVADTGHGLVKEILAVNGVIPSSNPTINSLGSGFTAPRGVSVDGGGNVYVADTGSSAIKEISGSAILTLGTGFTSPNSVALDSSGNVFVTDNGTNPANEMSVQNPPSLSFTGTPVVGTTSSDSPKSFSLMNNGNAALTFPIPTTGTNPSISINFSFDGTTTCPQLTPNSAVPATLSAGSTCLDAVNFTPTAAGSLTGTVTSTDNSLNVAGSTQTTALSGTGSAGTPVVTVSSASVAVNTSSVSLTASISYAGVSPGGTVTFAVNSGTAIAAACTGSSSPLTCTATYDPSSLNAGTYTILASIAADSNYNTASGSGTLTITKGTPTLTLTPTSGTSTVNGMVTFTVAVTPTSGIVPSGTVTFSTMLNGATGTSIPSCTSLSLVTGSATCQTSALQAGTNVVSASITGDSNFDSNSSNSATQTVSKATPTLTLTPQTGTSTVNDMATFTVSISPTSGIVPSGSISFSTMLNGAPGTSISSCTVTLVNGSATCQTSDLLAGTNVVGARFAGDSNFNSSNSNSATQTVSKATPTLTLTPLTSASTVNDMATFTVAVSPTIGIVPSGTVTFSTMLNGAAGPSLASCTSISLVNGSATCQTSALLAGTNLVSASFAGDSNFNPSNSNSATQTVSKANPTLTLTPASGTSVVNGMTTFTVAVSPTSGIVPGGTVSFSTMLNGAAGSPLASCTSLTLVNGSATCQTSALLAGTNLVSANFLGDSNFNSNNSNSATQTVSKANPTLTLTPASGASTVNGPVTFTVTISPNSGIMPAGSLSFKTAFSPAPPVNLIVDCTVVTPGPSLTATCTTSTLPAGANSVQATLAIDDNFNSAVSNTVLQTVSQAPTTLALTSSVPGHATVNQAVTVTATLSSTYPFTQTPITTNPTGTVSFTANSSPAPISGCEAIAVSAATHAATCTTTSLVAPSDVIVAKYMGDLNFGSSTSSQLAQIVDKAMPTVSVTSSLQSTASVNQTVTFVATITPVPFSLTGVAPTGGVTFINGADNSQLCSPVVVVPIPASGTATATCSKAFNSAYPSGVSIAANYSGDTNFLISSGNVTQTVLKGSATTTVTSTPNPSAVNSSVTLTASVTPLNTGVNYPGTATPKSGTVTFTDSVDSTTFCTSTLSAGVLQPASCQHIFVSSGTHTITAAFTAAADEPNFVSSTTATPLSQIVGAGSVTLTVSNPSAVTVNQPTTMLQATFSPLVAGQAVPQGTVTYLDGGNAILTCSNLTVLSMGVVPSCMATFQTAGMHPITAAFTSSNNDFGSFSSAAFSQVVSKNSPAVTVTSNLLTTAVVNQTITFTATITPTPNPSSGIAPTGSVAFTVAQGGAVLCPQAILSPGTAGTSFATCSTAFSSAYTSGLTINASYSGDTNFLPRSGTVTQTILKGSATTSVTSTPNPSAVNNPVTLTATVTPLNTGVGYPGTATPQSGTVTFTDSADSTTFCPSTLSAGVLQPATCQHIFISSGTHMVTAAFKAVNDPNFGDSTTTTPLPQVVGAGSVMFTVTNPSTVTVNQQTTTLQATFSPLVSGQAVPQGAVTYLDGGNAISTCSSLTVLAMGVVPSCMATFPTAGIHLITAAYTPSNNDFSPMTSVAFSQAVSKNLPAVTVTSNLLTTAVVNQTITFTATITPSPNPSSGTAPTGSVAFTVVQGGAVLCPQATVNPGTVAGTSFATCSTAFSTSYTSGITINASYSSDKNFLTNSNSLTQAVQPATPVITVSSSLSAGSVATQAVIFTATVAPSGSNPTAPTGPISFSIAQAGTGTSFQCSAAPAPTSTPPTETATCTVTGFGAGIVGNVAITARYGGDGNYNTATSTAINQTIGNFNPTVTPSKFSLSQGTATTPITNLSDPFLKVVIKSVPNNSPGFTDATAVTACAVVDASQKAVTGLTCVPSTAQGGVAVITATSAVPTGDYTVRLTVTDQVVTTLSQVATATITIVNQAPSVFNSGAISAVTTAAFSIPSSLGTPSASDLACNNANVATYNSTTSTYDAGRTFAQVGISCSPVTAGTTTGTYTFTLTSIGSSTVAKADSGPGKIFVAVLGAPLLFLLGFYPRARKHRKNLLRIMGMLAIAVASMHMTGCGSGGFTRTSSTSSLSGSYLVGIINTRTGAIVAEVPLLIGNGNNN